MEELKQKTGKLIRDKDGLHLGKFERRRPTFSKFISVYIKMSFKQLENHSQLLCGRDFENERLALPI